MRGRAGAGRTEVIVGVVVVVVVAAVAATLLLGRSDTSRRAEVPLYVEKIKTAELAYAEVFGDGVEFEACEAAPRGPTEVDENPVPWEPTRGFNRIAWSPDDLEQVWGSYRVVLTDDGFTVIGTSDVDGDGRRAVFEATKDSEGAVMTSDPDYY